MQQKEAAKQRETAEAELEAMPKRGRPSRRKPELLSFLADLQETMHPKQQKSGKRGRPRKEPLTPKYQEMLDRMAEGAKSIKGAKHALGHNPENCTESQADKIKLIENDYPNLYRAYQLKESLRLILRMKEATQAESELGKDH